MKESTRLRTYGILYCKAEAKVCRLEGKCAGIQVEALSGHRHLAHHTYWGSHAVRVLCSDTAAGKRTVLLLDSSVQQEEKI